MISHVQDIRYLEFAEKVLDVKFNLTDTVWLTGLYDDGLPYVVVVFNRFSPYNCEMSIATDGTKKWYPREFITTCFNYVFKQAKLRRCTVIVREDNKKSLKLCRQLGHTQEAILKNWFGDKDGVSFFMTRENCKWLK